jgi:hypothetical protein
MKTLAIKKPFTSLFLGTIIMFSLTGCDGVMSSTTMHNQSQTTTETSPISNVSQILATTTQLAHENGEDVLIYYENGIESERAPILIDQLFQGEIIVLFTSTPDLILHDIQDLGTYSVASYHSGARTNEELIRALQKVSAMPGVIFAEPNYKTNTNSTKKLHSFSDNI